MIESVSTNHRGSWTIAGITGGLMVVGLWLALRQSESPPAHREVRPGVYATIAVPRFEKPMWTKWLHRWTSLNLVRPRYPTLLTIGTNTLWWSMNNEWEKTGWLALWGPSTGKPFWEFAPCSNASLETVSPTDLPSRFFGMGDTNGTMVFGTNWVSNSLRVNEGAFIYARVSGDTSLVYLVHLARHPTNDIGGEVEAQYRVLSVDRSENSGK